MTAESWLFLPLDKNGVFLASLSLSDKEHYLFDDPDPWDLFILGGLLSFGDLLFEDFYLGDKLLGDLFGEGLGIVF